MKLVVTQKFVQNSFYFMKVVIMVCENIYRKNLWLNCNGKRLTYNKNEISFQIERKSRGLCLAHEILHWKTWGSNEHLLWKPFFSNVKKKSSKQKIMTKQNWKYLKFLESWYRKRTADKICKI